MATNTATIPIENLTKQMTVEIQITGVKIWNIKKNIAIALFKLGAWIMGTQIDIQVELKAKDILKWELERNKVFKGNIQIRKIK